MLTASSIADAVRAAIPEAACRLGDDVLSAMLAARERERSPRARAVLDQLIQNAHIASNEMVPICQDTGTVWVLVEIGADEAVPAGLHAAIDAAISGAYHDARLRMSTARDALFDRSNRGDNTPGFVEIASRPGVGATVSVMLKGGGSDNASRVEMLAPGAGEQGVMDVVIETVRLKATGACPPLVVGVGVGATFDKVGGLSKKALLRPVGSPNASPEAARFERELLEAVNALGIGPAGLGGDTTALAVHVATAPSHIASLPVAVNMGCSAMRRVAIEVAPS